MADECVEEFYVSDNYHYVIENMFIFEDMNDYSNFRLIDTSFYLYVLSTGVIWLREYNGEKRISSFVEVIHGVPQDLAFELLFHLTFLSNEISTKRMMIK